jgi:nucleotide-binding universal stress UspA family protein
MREIKKIIWASDGSKESEEALNHAVFLAKQYNSEIIGMNVIEMHPRLLYDYARNPDSEIYGWVVEAAEKQKSRLISSAKESGIQGIPFQATVVIGEPSEEIVKFARRMKVDLIAMGIRGMGLVDRVLVGSTALKVLRNSHIPVLILKKRDHEGAVGIHNILVPLDIYEQEDSALSYAIDLAQNIKANISVVYAYRLFTYAILESGKPPVGINELGEDALKSFSAKLAERIVEIKSKLNKDTEIDKLKINSDLVEGINPSLRIVEYATDKKMDLIVINTHGRKGIKKFILGSVTEKIIQESPCAVLALRP